MSLLTSFFLTLTRPINLLLDAYIWIIIARALYNKNGALSPDSKPMY